MRASLLLLATLMATPLGTVTVAFVPPATHLSVAAPAMLSGTEQFSLPPGTYSVRACYSPATNTGPVGGITQSVCGNGVSLTLVQ